MSCGSSAQCPIGIIRVSMLDKSTSSLRVSHYPKWESLKLNPVLGLGLCHSSKYRLNELKVSLMFRVRPRVTPSFSAFVVKCNHPQNENLPRYYSKKEKKPFPTPIVELRRAARERVKRLKGQPRKQVPPPRNGLLVGRLIPLAYEVFNTRITLINNVKKLLTVVPVQACKWCNEIHVGPAGHPFKSCRGQQNERRKGLHEWTKATIDNVILPVEAYHLYDRLGKRITHAERFSVPRIPAVNELCIQAGVNLPGMFQIWRACHYRELRSFYGQAPVVVEMCVQGGADAPEQYKSTMRLNIGIPRDISEAEMVV